MPLIAGIGSSQSVGPTSGGKVTPINSLGTTMAQVVGGNPARVSITFHNPGTISVYVAPTVNAQGAPFTPMGGALGGAFLILSGGLLTLTGEVQTPWQAMAASGSNQPLTITESNV